MFSLVSTLSMKIRLIPVGLALSYLAVVSAAFAERGNPEIAYQGKGVDELVAAYMKEHNVPGLSVAIVQAPYITRAQGYGYSDIGRKLLTGTNTVFEIGQMAEAFTAVAILQLVEAGKIKLDDPIQNYVPLAPQAWNNVTVRQLLQHQSGLPDYTKAKPTNPDEPQAALFQAVANTGPEFEPGTKTAPSATDHLLLQLVIENASGQSYESFIKANQFDKLGLKHTYFAGEAAALVRDLPTGNERPKKFLEDSGFINPTEPATGYQGNDPAPNVDTRALPARASIYATPEDISIWDIGLAGQILIKDPELRKIAYTPAKLKDGTVVPTSGPWYFPGHSGLMVATGSSRGFSSLLSRYTDPKELLCVTLLANKEGLDLTPLAERIAAAYDANIKPSEPKKEEPTPSPTAAPKAEASPTAAIDPKPTAKPETKPAVEPKPTAKPEAKSETKPAPTPEAKPTAAPETKPSATPAP